jgi:hypothetical protein
VKVLAAKKKEEKLYQCKEQSENVRLSSAFLPPERRDKQLAGWTIRGEFFYPMARMNSARI